MSGASTAHNRMSIAKGLKKEDKNFGARPKNKNPALGFTDRRNQKEKESGNMTNVTM